MHSVVHCKPVISLFQSCHSVSEVVSLQLIKMVMGKIHESLSKCIYCSFAGIMAKVWNALMQAGRASLNIKLGNGGGGEANKTEKKIWSHLYKEDISCQ